MIGETNAVMAMLSLSVGIANETTSYSFLLLSCEPNVVTLSNSFLTVFSCNASFRCCVMKDLCDPVSNRTRAWCLPVPPDTVTRADCMRIVVSEWSACVVPM